VNWNSDNWSNPETAAPARLRSAFEPNDPLVLRPELKIKAQASPQGRVLSMQQQEEFGSVASVPRRRTVETEGRKRVKLAGWVAWAPRLVPTAT